MAAEATKTVTHRVILPLLCFAAGCGDAAPASPGRCAALSVRVVAGPGAPRPLEGASLHLRGVSGGAATTATTGADGAGCVATAGLTAPYALTVFRRGYTATTLVGVRDVVEGPVRLDPIMTDARAPRAVSITVSALPTGASSVFVDAYDFEAVRGAGDQPLRSQLFEHPGLPFVVSALALDAQGRMVSLVSRDFGDRAVVGPAVDLAFGAAPTIVQGTAIVRFAAGGILSQPGALRTGDLIVMRLHRGLYGTTYMTAGAMRRSSLPVAQGGTLFDLQTAEGELAPDAALITFDPASVIARVNVWLHDFSSTRVEVPVVRRLAVGGAALGDVSFLYDGDRWEHAMLQVASRDASQSAWQVFALDASLPGELRVPDLPPGLRLSDLGLATGGVTVSGTLLQMHEGRPWSLVPEVGSEPEYVVAAGSEALDL